LRITSHLPKTHNGSRKWIITYKNLVKTFKNVWTCLAERREKDIRWPLISAKSDLERIAIRRRSNQPLR
jgi:hypothetical protein